MQKKTLEQIFNAVFHKEENFADFRGLDVSQEVEVRTFKDRDVYKASDKLKKYLRFINNVILRHVKTNSDVVHSYVKGKSSLTAVLAHTQSKYFFTTDIESFFSNIAAEYVNSMLRRNEDAIPISDLTEYIELIVNLVTYKGRLPVGFPTSPQISNAFLIDFDDQLKSYCDERGLIYTRYSDDIIVSGKGLKDLENLEQTVKQMLKRYASEELLINESKTRYTHLGNKVKILGLVITPHGKVTIDSKYKNSLESLIHFYINDKEKFSDLLNKSYRGKEHSLFGLLHYAKSIDLEYLGKLQRKYGAYTLNELMQNKWTNEG